MRAQISNLDLDWIAGLGLTFKLERASAWEELIEFKIMPTNRHRSSLINIREDERKSARLLVSAFSRELYVDDCQFANST
jgi:hypothetical protein